MQAGGQGFDSLILHGKQYKFFDRIKDEKRGHILEQKAGIWRKEKVRKSVWGMPGLLEAKKDVVSCEKPRGLANVN